MSKKTRPKVKNNPVQRPTRYENRKRHAKQTSGKTLLTLEQLKDSFIILLYIFVVTFTPNWMSLDTNTTKFLTLSLVNLLAFFYLITSPDIRNQPGIFLKVFKTNVGFVYAGFMVMTLLSFTQAINIHESIIHFSKTFSVFSGAIFLSVILMRDLRYVKMILLVMTALLVFDSISVFYYINRFIQGDVARIGDIKTIYSNKNILASSIYVKIPFALSMLMFDRGWQKYAGWITLFFGMLATFFMATRTFYLGLILLSVVFLTYTLLHFFRKREVHYLKLAGSYLAALVLAIVVYTYIQQYHYPGMREARMAERRAARIEALARSGETEGTETVGRPRARGGRHTQPITEQLATISWETGSRNRTNAWVWSLEIIRHNPLLGVGTGNWKINILEYENQQNPGFIYLYKAHNDFLENMAETGVLGGLLFIAIFIFMGLNFIKQYRKRADDPGVLYRALFLAASGLAFYAVDAFFNFPSDRPEILLLFALYVSMGIAASVIQREQAMSEKEDTAHHEVFKASTTDAPAFRHPAIAKALAALLILVMAAASYVLYLNYQSSKLQRVVYQEIMSGTLREPSYRIVGQFPRIPTLSVWGESITSLEARYLMEEQKYRETIEVLIDEDTNPWDSRREFFLAMAYHNLNMRDSAMYYSEKAYWLKPNYYRNLHLLLTLMERKGREEEMPAFIDRYLENDKRTQQAWLYATGFYDRQGELDKAWDLITEARQHLRRDSLIERQENYLYHRKFIEPNRRLFTQATRLYEAEDYEAAIEKFNEYIEIVNKDPNAYRLRAFSYYHTGRYQECIDDINFYLDNFDRNGSLINLRGVCLRNLGEPEDACRDFEEAMQMGVASGETNYRNFCQQ